jgi:hypothetical protein
MSDIRTIKQEDLDEGLLASLWHLYEVAQNFNTGPLSQEAENALNAVVEHLSEALREEVGAQLDVDSAVVPAPESFTRFNAWLNAVKGKQSWIPSWEE